MKKTTLTLAAVLLATVFAVGQEGPLTVEQCINLAMQTHPAIQAAQMGHRSAEYQRRMAISSALPSFKLEYSHTWLDEAPTFEIPGSPPSTMSGSLPNLFTPPPPATIPFTIDVPGTPPMSLPAGEDQIDSLTISATQPLFTGGATWNAWKLANLQRKDAMLQVEQAKQEIAFQVRSAFYGVLKAREFVKVAGQAVEMANSLRKRAQDFFDVGLVAKNNVLEAEVGAANAQQQLITAQSVQSVAKSVLLMLIGKPMSEDIEVEGQLEKVPFTMTMEDCIKKGLEQRPEAQSARIRVEMAECLRKIERAGWFPFIAAIAAYKRESGSLSSDPEVYSLTLAATWTFWEWGKKYYKVKSAAEMVKQTQQAVKLTEDQITLDIKQAYYKLREAEANIDVARLGLSSADENFRVMEAKFEQNMATSFDIITAQTYLTRARTSEVSALADYMTARAALERAMGLPVASEGQTAPAETPAASPAETPAATPEASPAETPAAVPGEAPAGPDSGNDNP